MSFGPKEIRAIGHCAKRYDRRLALCAWPYAYFSDKDTGEETKIHIKDVLEVYDTDKKEEAKERARQRRQEQKGLSR